MSNQISKSAGNDDVQVTRSVTRIGYASKDVTLMVPADATEAEIQHAIIEAAGNEHFSEHEADYVETSKVGELDQAAIQLLKLLNVLSSHGFGTEGAINAAEAVDALQEAYTSAVHALSGTAYEPMVYYSESENGFWCCDMGWGEIDLATHYYPSLEADHPPLCAENDARLVPWSLAVAKDYESKVQAAAQTPESEVSEPVSVVVNGFSFFTRAGSGMASTNGLFTLSQPYPVVTITGATHDEDTGWKFTGVSRDERLTEFLEAVADPFNTTVHFSEHQLEDGYDPFEQAIRFGSTLSEIKTSDGYTFKRMPNGSWSDGDMSFDSIHHLLTAADVVMESPTEEAASSPSQQQC